MWASALSPVSLSLSPVVWNCFDPQNKLFDLIIYISIFFQASNRGPPSQASVSSGGGSSGTAANAAAAGECNIITQNRSVATVGGAIELIPLNECKTSIVFGFLQGRTLTIEDGPRVLAYEAPSSAMVYSLWWSTVLTRCTTEVDIFLYNNN